VQLGVVSSRSQEAREGDGGLGKSGSLQGAGSGCRLGVAGGDRLGAPHLQWMHHVFAELFVRAVNLVLCDVLDVTESLFIPENHKNIYT